jgi:hypothetical protein
LAVLCLASVFAFNISLASTMGAKKEEKKEMKKGKKSSK